MKKWVFFDFDGVIIDSETISLRSWKSLLKDPESISASDISGNSARANAIKFENLFKEKKDIDELIQIKLALDEAQLSDGYYPLVKGVQNAIQNLSRTYNLAVVTSNSETVTKCHLDFYDLGKYFSNYICARSRTRKKPCPDLYLEALRMCKCGSDDSIAIEDSAAGIESARGANVRVVGFGDATRTNDGHCFWLNGFENEQLLLNAVKGLLA